MWKMNQVRRHHFVEFAGLLLGLMLLSRLQILVVDIYPRPYEAAKCRSTTVLWAAEIGLASRSCETVDLDGCLGKSSPRRRLSSFIYRDDRSETIGIT